MVGLVNAVLPPRCVVCGALLGTGEGVCPTCFPTLSFLTEPLCALCGCPLPGGPAAPGERCGACLAQPPVFERARAVLLYNEGAASMVLGFKYADRTDAAPVLARWMARAGQGLLTPETILVPVPLHWTRLFVRRYNQSALLAQALGRRTGLLVAPDALRRLRRTPPQQSLSREERHNNVRGAFAVARPAVVGDRPVVLVDDVLTTGATATACARVLKAAGALRVDLLTLARVSP